MKYAVIMNSNSYPGREYLNSLQKLDIKPDVIVIGNFEEFDQEEDRRCGGLWNPPQQINLTSIFRFFYFESLKSESLIKFLQESNYELAIQGGTGILKKGIIELFRYGILNFHPGDLPEYRGCSAPEWQLYEGKPLIVTCHLVDQGIDTGNIVAKKTLQSDYTSYQKYRASVYPLTASFIFELFSDFNSLKLLINNAYTQDESKAHYRKYIGSEKISEIENKLIGQNIDDISKENYFEN
jgi:methionyl-tRNA formyltransferase